MPRRGTSRLAFLRVSHSPTTAVSAAMPPRPIIQRNDQYVIHRIGAKLPSTWSANCGNISVAYSAFRSLMPSTQPSSVCVERKASRYGTRIENSSLVPSGVPSVKIENDASAPQALSNIASAAAIFIGCVCTITRLSWSPDSATPANAMIMPHSP